MTTRQSLRVPMQVEYKPAWLSWVGSTTGCLNALGVDCDLADVAGYSGLAFFINVHEEVCPSGPTALDWQTLLRGVSCLGRSTLVFAATESPADGGREGALDRRRAAYDLVSREIEAGRPCVLWGTYVPEFGIAVGVENGSYCVESFKAHMNEPQPAIPLDELAAPGGPYVLAFPTTAEVPQEAADRYAVCHAVEVLEHRTACGPYATGVAGYETWVSALEQGRAEPMGNSYNAQCWAEAKRFARDFLSRLVERNEHAAEPLRQAVAEYARAADAMGKLAQLFPFPGENREVDDPAKRAEGIEALRTSRDAEARAAGALSRAAADWPLH